MDQSAEQPRLRNFISPPGAGRPEDVVGVTHTYRLEEQQSGGRLACIEIDVHPGHGVPPHTHHLEDETFYVLEGMIEIVGDDLSGPANLPRGSLFYSPKGRMHGFRNATNDPARMIVFMTPGGNMQRMFAALAELTARTQGKPEPAAVTELCARYDIIFAPPPG
jgi:mannose-6-phosphate isomerase-like protein (cupin superfamily)